MKCPNCGEDDNEVHQVHSQHNFMMKKNLLTKHYFNCGYLFPTEEVPAGDPFRMKNGKKIPKKDEGQASFLIHKTTKSGLSLASIIS